MLLRSESAEPLFNRSSRVRRSDVPGRHGLRPPSAVGYFAVSGLVAGLLFLVVWSMLHNTNEEAPWAAALVACVVLLIAASAREILVRRAWSRQLLDADGRVRPDSFSGRNTFHNTPTMPGTTRASGTSRTASGWSHTAALRAVQKQSAEADAADAAENHQELCRLCEEYLNTTEEALRSPKLMAEKRVVMRSGQERVRVLRKHHWKAWARLKSNTTIQEAQYRVRLYDKVETAQSALRTLATALAEYPDDHDLLGSQAAVNEFIAAARIAHWVEIAERAAFRGNYRRAIARYRDALFYVSREVAHEDSREELAAGIQREITALRAKIANINAFDEATPPDLPPSNPTHEA